jgi:GNAT superfamily N-acetyltransferase
VRKKDKKFMTDLIIRPATKNDAASILYFIRELAIYEKAEHEVVATPEHIERTMFSDNPQAFGLMCLDGDKAIGFAVYFFSYSTWLGHKNLYLEDLYVTPEARGKGAGKAFFKSLAQIALDEKCERFEWSVLDWNTPSIAFYESLGGKAQNEWIRYRLTGDEIKNLL